VSALSGFFCCIESKIITAAALVGCAGFGFSIVTTTTLALKSSRPSVVLLGQRPSSLPRSGECRQCARRALVGVREKRA